MTMRSNEKQKLSLPRNTSREFLFVPSLVMSAVAVVLAAPTATFAQNNGSPQAIIDAQAAEIARLQRENMALRQGIKPPENTAPAALPAATADVTPGRTPGATELDSVVVKGRRTVALEQVKEAPKSISIVSGEELELYNTANFREIVTKIGNVGMTNSNPQTASLYIRGLGVTGKLNGLDPSVGVTIDGVSYATSAMISSFSYIDLESVDVTRGPTGTLGGKNANVGQINIATRAPSFTPSADASLTVGDSILAANAAVGGPVIDGLLAWRGSFYREQVRGTIPNQDDGNYTYRNRDRTYGRLQFLVTPTPQIKARLSADITPHANEGSDNASVFPRATPATYDSIDPKTGKPKVVNQAEEAAAKLGRRWFKQEANWSVNGNYLNNEINILNQNYTVYGSKGASANVSWDVGQHTLQSITGYRDYYFSSGGASDNPFDLVRPRTSGQVDNKQLSQEFRISSQEGGKLDYVAGLYLLKVDIPNRVNLARYGSDAGAYYANEAQYTALDKDTSGRYLLLNSLDRLSTKLKEEYTNTSKAIYGNVNWHATSALSISSGLRLTKEHRHSEASSVVTDNGFGAALNPVSKNNVQLGGFISDKDTGALSSKNTPEQTRLANEVAQTYFGVATYNALLPEQKAQVAQAKAIRNTRLGTLFGQSTAQTFDEVLPTYQVSPSYKLNEEHSVYASYQHGEKAGVSQIIGATSAGGKSAPNKKEVSNAYELGIKSSLLGNTLTTSAAVYLNNIKDYIQPMFFEDQAQTIANNDGKIAYTSGLGNVPKVQARGLELDAAYTGLRFTTLRFAGAYNDARYKDFKFLANPSEVSDGTSYYDATGKTLPYAPKFTANVAAEYARPVFGSYLFHTGVSYKYSTSYNSDQSLSRYAVVRGYGLTDLSIGVGRSDKSYDVNLVIKNLFDTDTSYTPTWNTFYPTDARRAAITFSAKL
jgi:iron complex outermembrane receptor protein